MSGDEEEDSDSAIEVSLVELSRPGPRDGERAIRFTVKAHSGEEMIAVQAKAEAARGVYEDLKEMLPLLEGKQDQFKSLRELTAAIAVQAGWARAAHEAGSLRFQRNLLFVVSLFLSVLLGLILSGRLR